MAELSGKWTLNKKLTEPSSEIKQSFLVTLGGGYLCSNVRITNNKLTSGVPSAYGTVIDATWGGLGSGQSTGIAGYIYSDREGWAESKPEFQIWDFGTTPQYVSDEFYYYFTENAKQNLQIDVETNGTMSLTVQDKQCDRAIDVNVDVPTIIEVAELPLLNIDTRSVYKCNGNLYRCTNVSTDSLLGTWVFKETLDFSPFDGSSTEFDVDFSFTTPEGEVGEGFKMVVWYDDGDGIWRFFYRFAYTTNVYTSASKWGRGDEYRTITINAEPTNETLVAWVKSNALKWVEYSESSEIIVPEIPEGYIKPEGELIIDRNNKIYDVTEYATIKVNTANPYEVSSESFMNTLVHELVGSTIGGVYKYVGETTDTYENGALYILEEVSE